MINTKVMKWKSVKKRRNENQITTTKKIGEPQIMTVLNQHTQMRKSNERTSYRVIYRRGNFSGTLYVNFDHSKNKLERY